MVHQLILKIKWNVSGSRFIIMDPIDSTKIYVSWDSTTTDKKICLTLESECFTSPEICTDVIIDYGVAVRDINIDNVSIYPVPNNGQFVIVGLPYSERTKIEIISLNGKNILITFIRWMMAKFQLICLDLEYLTLLTL